MKTLSRMVAIAGLVVGGAAFAQGGAPADKDKKPAAAEKADKPPASAAAKPPEGMGMPMKASPEIEQMAKSMLGTWKCEGKMSGDGMEMNMKSTYKVTWDYDSMWLVGRIDGAKQKGMPKAYRGVDYYTYDPEKKEFVMLSLDNMGAYGRSTAKAPEGDKQTWSGKSSMMGHEADTKMVVTRKGDKELTLDMSETAPGHNMSGQLTCKK